MTTDDPMVLRAEIAQLKDALRLRDDALRLAKVAHWYWDAQTDRIEYNKPEFYAVLGFPTDQAYEHYEDCKRHVHPDDIEHVNAVYEQADSAKEDFAVTYRLCNPDGRVRSVYELGRAEYDESGQFLGHRGIIQDVTAHQETEAALQEALKQSEQRLRGFTEAASDWFWEQDAELRFTYVSDQHKKEQLVDGESLLGRRRDEIFRRGIPEEEEQWRAHLETLAARRNFRDFAYSYRRPDGEFRVLCISGVAVFDRNGRFQGYRGVGSDITAEVAERRRLEDAEEKLRQAQKMESIGQMTGGVAHDFNNLLAIIQGNAELLLATRTGGDPMLEAIVRASGRGASLVQRMLAFARRQALYPKAFCLDERVEQMLKMLRRTLGEAIEIDFKPGAGEWSCLADAGQVDNALLNLALNARDAMPTGGRLELSSHQVTIDAAGGSGSKGGPSDLSSGDYLVLSVRDNGSGIGPQDLENVFEPFFTTKEFGRGSGLGLSMVYGFAKQSGGHVRLESVAEKGTTAYLYLPRTQQAARPESAVMPNDVPRGHGERILVVEDKDDVRSLVKKQLEQLGYETSSAARGEDALALLNSEGPFDLLLSDVVLPGKLSGAALAAKACGQDADLRVLLMSGYYGSVFGSEAPGLDEWPLIRKPFRRAKLAVALRRVLQEAPKASGALIAENSR